MRCCPCSELQWGGVLAPQHPSAWGREVPHVFGTEGQKGKEKRGRVGWEWGGCVCFRAPQKEQILLGGLGSIFQHAEPRAINTPSTVIA